MTQPWGGIVDSDTLDGVERYRQQGLRLRTPSDLRGLDMTTMSEIAERCSDLIRHRYNGNYPSHIMSVGALASSMVCGETLMFTLEDDFSLVAMASLVRRSGAVNAGLGFADLCRVTKTPDERAADTAVRFLSKYRLHWAMKNGNLSGVDFLCCMVRVASEGTDGVAGGQRAQSVWWGGHRHGVRLPLIPTYVGWGFRIGGIEPQTAFMVPVDPQKWAQALGRQAVYVPDESVRHSIQTLFTEATDRRVVPPLVVCHQAARSLPITFRQVRPPSDIVAAQYCVTNYDTGMVVRSSAEVDDQLWHSISQKVVIECDILATPRGAQVARQLLACGWALAGWQPSEAVYGGIGLVLTRVNPRYRHQLIHPLHCSKYFNGGLSGTRDILDRMFQTIYSS